MGSSNLIYESNKIILLPINYFIMIKFLVLIKKLIDVNPGSFKPREEVNIYNDPNALLRTIFSSSSEELRVSILRASIRV